ncbi:SDR family oxidoreductase [Chitinophagaceae bacterium 26-R-25]|nr:SDR family oxidoreductase [Chitinophagaceae bacterium 26-R-25]
MKPQLIDVPFENKHTIQLKKVDQFYLDNPFHFHHLCELVWIEESFGKRIIGDKIDSFSDGELVLMSPDLPHIWQNDPVFFHKKKGYRCKATVIYFPADFILKLSDEPAIVHPIQELISNASRGLKFYGDAYEQVTKLLVNISDTSGLEKIICFLNVIKILAQSKEFELLASESYKNVYSEKDTNRIDAVYKFLMHNFHRNVSLEEVSKICNMTPTAFCRFFKSRTKKSLVQVLNELRVGHACKLLHNEDYTIAAQAERQRTIDLHPVKKLGTVDEIGGWCVFLASDYAAFASGTTYLVDGGRSALMQD